MKSSRITRKYDCFLCFNICINIITEYPHCLKYILYNPIAKQQMWALQNHVINSQFGGWGEPNTFNTWLPCSVVFSLYHNAVTFLVKEY